VWIGKMTQVPEECTVELSGSLPRVYRHALLVGFPLVRDDRAVDALKLDGSDTEVNTRVSDVSLSPG